MKHIIFLLFALCFYISGFGQSYSDYNRKGDLAMEEKDYRTARTLYAQGLNNCDFHSIRKLTEIWEIQPEMQHGMRISIDRCRACLIKLIEMEDSNTQLNAMLLLADYYNKGIGGAKDSITADYWKKEAATIIGLPVISENEPYTTDSIPKITPDSIIISRPPAFMRFIDRNNIFLAYTYSPTMPVGITIGGYKKFGIALSYRTSYTFQDYSYHIDNEGKIPGISEGNTYELVADDEKWQSWMVTGSFFIPVITKNFFLSAGSGYARRNFYCHAVSNPQKNIFNGKDNAWCYNTQASYEGIVMEAGVLFRYKSMIFSANANSLEFRDLDGNLSIGIVF